jgi:hypothetical protein
MATKKKKKAKTAARKKATPRQTLKRPQKAAKNKPASKKPKKKAASRKKQPSRKSSRRGTLEVSSQDRASRSGEQSGDLQGLVRPEGADSQSVDELLEEGNAFEADAVIGVEDAGDAEGKEVRTHEVPEDDVPGEYLDED